MKGTGREFVEKTKFQYLDPSDQYLGLPQPPLERSTPGRSIDLPSPDTCPRRRIDLTEAITARQSVRIYSRSPLSLSELEIRGAGVQVCLY
jgi:hypothetical protein